MKRNLWYLMILPLIGGTIFSIVANFLFETDGFFINLSTELIGILITVLYIEWIIRKNEAEKWLGTDERVNERMKILINGTVSGITSSLGCKAPISYTTDTEKIHMEIMTHCENLQFDSINKRLRDLKKEGWQKLSLHLEYILRGNINYLTLFQNRLAPNQINLLLDLDEKINYCLFFYRAFPEFVGVSYQQLPENITPYVDKTAEDMREILSITLQIDKTLTKKSL